MRQRQPSQCPRFGRLESKVTLAIVLALVSMNVAAAYAGNHPTRMDIRLREMLCANQMAMCTSSCRGPDHIQDNTCNEETLEWSCVCTAGATKAFNDWQYPIPFKLCRMDQLTCLHACPKLGMSALGQEATEGNLEGSRLLQQQQRQSRLSFPLEASDHMDGDDDDGDDFDQDDVDAIEELQLLHRQSKLEEDTYSRFEKEGRQESIANKKKKQLHKQLWARQRNEIEEGDFITLFDPTARRDPACALRCQEEYACGTMTAPTYQGVMQIPSD